MTRVLYVHSRRNTFTALDRQALEEGFEVSDYFQPGLIPKPLELWRGVRRADVVFGWFASWHTLWALTLAWILRRPSVLVIGGFDTAAMPEIGYGAQRPGLRRFFTRWTMRRATRLVTNSEYLLSEIDRNTPLDPRRVAVVHHGIPDRFGEPEPRPAAQPPLVLTVGVVYATNLTRKGHAGFAAAAALVPEARFVLAGPWNDETHGQLTAEASPNMTLTGRLSDADLDNLFRQAAVYVQASAHEGFGLSLAEAMLAGAVPVTTPVAALPEVVGDTGVVISSAAPEEIAAGVRRALELGPEAGRAARDRVLREFTYERRRDALRREAELAAAGGP